MTLIVTDELQILDSSGQPATGRITFTQSARVMTADALVTTSVGTVTVRNGRIEAPRVLELPPTPDGEGVLVEEQFLDRGQPTLPVRYWVTVPNDTSVEYAVLPQITSPTSGPGMPPWVKYILDALGGGGISGGGVIVLESNAEILEGTPANTVLVRKV